MSSPQLDPIVTHTVSVSLFVRFGRVLYNVLRHSKLVEYMLYGKSILYCTIYMYRSAGTAQKMRSVANQQIFVRDENNATVFFFLL